VKKDTGTGIQLLMAVLLHLEKICGSNSSQILVNNNWEAACQMLQLAFMLEQTAAARLK